MSSLPLLEPCIPSLSPPSLHPNLREVFCCWPCLAQVYEEVLCWPPPAWGSPMTLPLGDVGTITARLPELSTLPGVNVPAVAACRSAPPSPPARSSSRASSPLPAGTGTFSPPKALAAAAVSTAAGAGSCSPGRLGAGDGLQWGPAGGGSTSNGEGLLAELDEQMGLPLCLLPQAYGQQELVEGPFAEVGRLSLVERLKHTTN